MRINVVGSKPDSLVLPCDKAYFANGAGATQPNELSASKNCIQVIAGSAVKAAKNRPWLREQIKLLAEKSSGSRVYIVDIQRDALDVESEFNLVFGRDCALIGKRERRKLLQEIASTTLPIGVRVEIEKSTFKVKLRLLFLLIKMQVLNLSVLVGATKVPRDWPAAFRPSTGVTTLLLAIYQNGPKARYQLCGIGASQRNSYPHGNVVPQVFPPLEPHITADIVILRRLKNRYNLVTTDQGLSEKTGIPITLDEYSKAKEIEKIN